jgi:hypothetical protein
MADRARRTRRQQDTPSPPVVRSIDSDEAERSLGRAVALGLPVATVGGAIVAGYVASVGSGILVLAAGTLLGTIALLWASVRTLTGDAPLSSQLESRSGTGLGVDDLAERKRRVLRALKDLEAEHAIGKIDDEDFAAVTARYRDEAKDLMREMDLEVAPLRPEAERIARDYLDGQGRDLPAEEPPPSAPAATPVAPPDAADRVDCVACGKSNDADAAFCKHCGATMKRGSSEKADATT